MAAAQLPGLPELIVIDDSSDDDDDSVVILTPLPPVALPAAAAAPPLPAAAAGQDHQQQQHHMQEDEDSYNGEDDEDEDEDDMDEDDNEYVYSCSQSSARHGPTTLGHVLLDGWTLCRHELSGVFGHVLVQQWSDAVKVHFSLQGCRWVVKLHLSPQNPKTMAKVDVAVGPLARGSSLGKAGELFEQTGRLASLRRLFDRYLRYALDAGGRDVDTAAFNNLVEAGLTAAYSRHNRLQDISHVSFADAAAIRSDAARINDRLRAAVRQQNPLRRVLCVMQHLIETTWEWCACCGRLDNPEARGAHGDPQVLPDRAGSCTADTCHFLFTTSEDCIHAAEETIRIGRDVFRFLLTVMSAAASHDAAALFSHVPNHYHLGLTEDKKGTRVDYALLRRDLQALEGALTWQVVEDALYLPRALRRKRRLKKEEEAKRRLKEDGLQRFLAATATVKAEKRRTGKKEQEEGAAAAAATAAAAAAAAAAAEAEEEEKAMATDKETLMKLMFGRLFPDRGLNMYKLYWWVLKAYNTSFVHVPLERLRAYSDARKAHLGGAHCLVQEHPARLESFLANIAARFQQNGKSNLCLLELRNDRRPSKLAFEKLVGEAMTQSRARQGPSAQLGWSFHGSHKHRWHSLLTLGVLKLSGTRHMTTGMVYGAGVYTSPDLNTSLQYAGHVQQVSPNGGAVAIVEYLTGDGRGTSFLSHTKPHIVISEERAVSIKFLLLALPEAREGEADDDNDDDDDNDEKKAAAGGGKK